MNIIYFIVSLDHGHSISGSFASWSLSQEAGPGSTVSSESWTREGLASQAHPAVVGNIQFLIGCWTKDFKFLLAVGHRSLSFLCHVNLSHTTACFNKTYKPRRQQRGSACKMEVAIFCNSVTKVEPITFAIDCYLELSH